MDKYVSIEELGLSIGLYNKFKRAGINDVYGISKFDMNKLKKIELSEVIQLLCDFDKDGEVPLGEIACSDELYQRFLKLNISKVSEIPEKGFGKYSKKELLELILEFETHYRYQF